VIGFVLSARPRAACCSIPFSIPDRLRKSVGLEDLKQFRQWGLQDAGPPGKPFEDPEALRSPTGPLGQGDRQRGGLAIAEAHLGRQVQPAFGSIWFDPVTYVYW